MRLLRLPALLLASSLACAAAAAQTPGLVPLDDLGSGTYQGFEGGLYPGGVNVPPLAHLDRAMQLAAAIEPLDAAGDPDPDGAIVLVAIGMSNTNQEFAVFERQEDAGVERNARVVLLDGAVGGQDAVTLANPNAPYWTTVASRLAAMDLAPEQVQVAWLKEAVQGGVPPFPTDALELRGWLEAIVQILHDRFPNLRLCYLSSRIYGGYNASGEPKAYDTGFAVKWLIEDQIDGDPALNDGRLPGPVEAPLLLWGPYLWANGPTPRSDGLVWLAGDLESDGTHPAPSGERKVADLLSGFFDAEVTAAAWWSRRSDAALVPVAADKDAHVDASHPATNFGSASALAVQGGAMPKNTYLGFSLPSLGAAVLGAKLSLRIPTNTVGGGTVSIVADSSWTEAGITWQNAPPLGGTVESVPPSSRDGTIAAGVAVEVNADADGVLSIGLATPATGAGGYHSREAGQPPRLILTVSCAGGGPPGIADEDGDGVKDVCDCEPLDGSTLVAPPEVANLRWIGPADLAWDPVAAISGSSTVYDVMSGDLAGVGSLWPASGDLCIADDLGAQQATDTTPLPLPGAGVYFLVRAQNPCGAGRWETASDGRDRLASVCF